MGSAVDATQSRAIQAKTRFVSALISVSRISTIIVVLIGCLVLIGWTFDLPALKSLRSGLVAMKANTAIAFVLLGMALWWSRLESASQARLRFVSAATLIIALVALLTLGVYVFGWDLGIDQWLFKERVGSLGTTSPGRMAPHTALNFLFLSVALRCLIARRYRAAQGLVLIVALITLLTLVDSLYGDVFPYIVEMAWLTSLAFLALCLGLLLRDPRRGLMAIVTSEHAGGFWARRLIPLTIILPVALGWLRLIGQQAGWYSSEFGAAITSLSSLIIFTSVIWWSAQSLNRVDAERRQLEEKFRDLLEAAPDAMVIVNQQEYIVLVNAQAERLFGYRREELYGQPVEILLPQRYRRQHQVHCHNYLVAPQARPMGQGLELLGCRKDGSEFPVEISLSPLETREGILVSSAVRDVTARKQAEKALRESEERYRRIVDTAQEGVWMIDAEARTGYVNQRMAELLGYTVAEMIGRSVFDFMDEAACAEAAQKLERRKQGIKEQHDFRFRRQDGTDLWTIVTTSPMFDDQGQFTGALGMLTDITERRQAEDERQRLEAQLFQAQKMESIGTLAGGVAHDFNNILTAILGNTQLACARLRTDDPLQANLNEIADAANRAAELTKQLLAFGRRQRLERRVLNLNELIGNFMQMLQRIIGEDVEVQWRAAPHLAPVFVDPGQIEQVIMNLAVNARDAMPGGGQLTLETCKITLDEAYCREHPWARPEQYAQFTIRDTGCGMDADTCARIFEPFFTTKVVGKGTGLGLAMAYGIIKQHDGLIHVYSEPGHGTTFKIYLPLAEPCVEEETRAAPAALRGGTETILIAEDEEALQKLAQEVLTEMGYTVWLASDGAEAVKLHQAHRGEIDLVVLDVIMPRLGGPSAYAQMRQLNQHLPVIFMTGYSAEIVCGQTIGPRATVLQKPYCLTDLVGKVRETLDQAKRSLSQAS